MHHWTVTPQHMPPLLSVAAERRCTPVFGLVEGAHVHLLHARQYTAPVIRVPATPIAFTPSVSGEQGSHGISAPLFPVAAQ
jgi:hypothetical protein